MLFLGRIPPRGLPVRELQDHARVIVDECRIEDPVLLSVPPKDLDLLPYEAVARVRNLLGAG